MHIVLAIDACRLVAHQARPRHGGRDGGMQRVGVGARTDGEQMHGLEDDGALAGERERLGLEWLLGAARVGKEQKRGTVRRRRRRAFESRYAEEQRADEVELLATEIRVPVAGEAGAREQQAERCELRLQRHTRGATSRTRSIVTA